jgi:ribosomal protein S6--L-glutamate ligase
VKICLLMDRLGHPVLEAAAQALEKQGASVAIVHVASEPIPEDADLYLLKSRAARALRAALHAELHGASVINSVAATASCLDRVLLARRMEQAAIPFPQTSRAPTLERLIASSSTHLDAWPIVVKSRRSRRGDLVRRVDSSAELGTLAADWGREAVIAQPLVGDDEWELKVWVIGERIYAARRRPKFGECPAHAEVRVPHEQLPEEIEALARAAGAALGLELYGIDVLCCERGPVIVDVNPFPGFRSVPSAGEALADHVMRRVGREQAVA